MKPRLSRPALAVLVGSALVAGGAVTGSPAHASPGSASADSTSHTPAIDSSATVSGAEAPALVADSGTPDLSTVDPGTTEPGTTDPEPPAADTTKPTGSFRLDHSSVWTGQKITVGQNATEFSDAGDARDVLKRVISWGDGTSTTLSPATFTAAKVYAKAGNFKVTVTITDPAGNQSAIPARTVAVTVPAATMSLSKKTAYQGVTFAVKVAKAPAGATGWRIDWSDGWVSTHKATTKSVTGEVHYYWKWDGAKKRYYRVGTGRIAGLRAIKVSWGNAKGYATPQPVGNINILKDSWKPTLTITKPSSSNRASSWKTVRGTVADKGSGIRHLGVTVTRVSASGKRYCLTSANKWKRVYDSAGWSKHCGSNGVEVKIVKGKWSLKVPAGIAKNQQIWVDAWTYDQADNFRGLYKSAKITRS